MTDPNLLGKLKAMSGRSDSQLSIRYDAIDFDALRRKTVLDAPSALRATSAALDPRVFLSRLRSLKYATRY